MYSSLFQSLYAVWHGQPTERERFSSSDSLHVSLAACDIFIAYLLTSLSVKSNENRSVFARAMDMSTVSPFAGFAAIHSHS